MDRRKFKPEEDLIQQNKVSGNSNCEVIIEPKSIESEYYEEVFIYNHKWLDIYNVAGFIIK